MTAILVISVLAMFTASASAADYYVRTGGLDDASRSGLTNNDATAWKTIQYAIDRPQVTAGDTIHVAAGDYSENVDVTKAHLTLQGEGADVVTVTAAATNDGVFYVTEDYVNISGFTATGATDMAGIYLFSADHCNIYDNNASGNNYGIALDSSSNNNMLTSNAANSNAANGILLLFSSGNTLTSNAANSNAANGIYLVFSSSNTLTSNTANSNSQYGIKLFDSSGNTLTNNAFTNPGAINAEDDAATAGLNAWNTTTTGNYYSDYGGSGTYAIPGGSSIDYHPLMNPLPPVPELATIVLFSVGLLMLAGYVRVGRRK